MLILLDLDDTLIDTSGSLRRHKLELSLRAMTRRGLVVPDEEWALERLLVLAESLGSVPAALQRFLEEHHQVSALFEVGRAVYYGPLESDQSIKVLDEAPAVLAQLKQSHRLVLVTVGVEAQQLEKLQRAGIERSLFDEIAVTPFRNKRPLYERLTRGTARREVLVCGDKVEIDLLPAKELGMTTVYICRREATLPLKGVDYTIHSLSGLQEIAAQLQTLISS